MFKGEEVRVKEKVVVESSADPSLLSLGAKLGLKINPTSI